MNDKNSLFKFSFKTVYGSNEDVFSIDRHNMDLFLVQHMFNPNLADVKLINDDSKYLTSHILQPINFCSNKANKIYRIMTTDSINCTIIHNIAFDISDTLNMGKEIYYNNSKVELYDIIKKLINAIPYASLIYDEDNYPAYSSYILDGEKYEESYDLFIINQLMSSTNEKNVMPITLEGYVSGFTDIILNRYI